jgi:formamidopyrimidine-DNA glycosylase
MTARDLRAVLRGLDWTLARTLHDLETHPETDEGPWVVYGRKGKPCRRCKTTLLQLELGGRTTTYCPGCQVLKRRAPLRAASARK